MIITPMFSITLQKSCTAVFDLNEHKWTAIKRDGRPPIQHGRLMKIPYTMSRIIFMGGIYNDTGKPQTSIYEFMGINEGWKQWRFRMPININPEDTFIPLDDNRFC